MSSEVTPRITTTRTQPINDTAASATAVQVMMLVGSDMVASTHIFAVTCNVKRAVSACARGEIGSVCGLS